MRRTYLITFLAGVAFTAVGCAETVRGGQANPTDSPSALALDLAMTRPLGIGAAFRPGPLGNQAVAAGAPIGRWRCADHAGSVYGSHIELFANNHEVLVPAGIGIAAPQRRHGVFVLGGRCVYGLRTVDPTGVIRVARGSSPAPTVGDLFALWGQPLSRARLVGFTGPVVAFIDGRRWAGDPRAISLTPHAQIVLEVGPPVPPHRAYLFPKGL